jgi:hypothetical protein
MPKGSSGWRQRWRWRWPRRQTAPICTASPARGIQEPAQKPIPVEEMPHNLPTTSPASPPQSFVKHQPRDHFPCLRRSLLDEHTHPSPEVGLGFLISFFAASPLASTSREKRLQVSRTSTTSFHPSRLRSRRFHNLQQGRIVDQRVAQNLLLLILPPA